MNKIGILGGTFDPIHYGHLFIAENAMGFIALDKVIFIPTGTPPHKLSLNITDKMHRYNMTKLAIDDNPNFDISKIEVDRNNICYTIDTILELEKIYPNSTFCYIVGADSLLDMVHWKDFKKLFNKIEIISINRITSNTVDFYEASKRMKEEYGAKIHTLEMPILEVSSTEIRRRIKENLPLRYMLPNSVIEYIFSNDIYERK